MNQRRVYFHWTFENICRNYVKFIKNMWKICLRCYSLETPILRHVPKWFIIKISPVNQNFVYLLQILYFSYFQIDFLPTKTSGVESDIFMKFIPKFWLIGNHKIVQSFGQERITVRIWIFIIVFGLWYRSGCTEHC
jgi:hypothetical protein